MPGKAARDDAAQRQAILVTAVLMVVLSQRAAFAQDEYSSEDLMIDAAVATIHPSGTKSEPEAVKVFEGVPMERVIRLPPEYTIEGQLDRHPVLSGGNRLYDGSVDRAEGLDASEDAPKGREWQPPEQDE